MLRAIYRAAWWLVAPLAVLRLLLRSRRERGYREHIGERFGYARGRVPEDDAPLIWVHAVSVGETRAAQPLVDALIAARPDARILLTHMTPGGRAMGEKLFGARVLRAYLPYDMPRTMRRFLRAWRPALGLVMETEVWPALIHECRRASVPLVLTNARMSARSFRSYQRAARFGRATREMFGGFARVLAQTDADAQRLVALGARNVAVLGNLKFDMHCPPELIARGRAWKAAIGARPVWVAASTREGEEALVLRAFAALDVPGALLILVPRHPQRCDEVAALAGRAGFRVARRSAWGGRGVAALAGAASVGGAVASASGVSASASVVPAFSASVDTPAASAASKGAPAGAASAAATVAGASGAAGTAAASGASGAPAPFAALAASASLRPLPADVNVLLGDSMGEMGAYYVAADVAFIGGSLLPFGAQNLIEACALGTPVLIGPHVFNFAQAVADAVEARAAQQVSDPAALADALRALFADPARRTAMGAAAFAFAARHRGATARTVEALTALLPAASATAEDGLLRV